VAGPQWKKKEGRRGRGRGCPYSQNKTLKKEKGGRKKKRGCSAFPTLTIPLSEKEGQGRGGEGEVELTLMLGVVCSMEGKGGRGWERRGTNAMHPLYMFQGNKGGKRGRRRHSAL